MGEIPLPPDRLAQILSNETPLGLILADAQGCVLHSNDTLASLLGYSGPELEGCSYAALTDERDLAAARALFAELISGKRDRYTSVKRLRRRDGTPVWVRMHIQLVPGPEMDPVAVATIEDLTASYDAVEALHESEERFRAVFHGFDVPMNLTGPDEVWIDCNQAFADLLGYPREALIGIPFARVTHPDDVELDREHYGQLVAGTRQSYVIEKRYIRQDGSLVWVRLSVSGIYDTSGAILYTAALAEDISELKRATASLRESEERFRAQYQTIPLAIATWIGRENDWFLHEYNHVADALTGGHFADLLETGARQVYADAPDIVADFERCWRERGQVVRERTYTIPGRGARDFASTYVFVAPDMIMVFGWDVTEKKAAERALRESEELYRSLVETSPYGVLLAEFSGTIVTANPQAARLYGYEQAEDLTGRSLGSLLPPPERERARADWQRIVHDSAALDMKYSMVRQDGSTFPAEISVRLVRDEAEEITGVLAVVRDITARKRAETAIRQSEKQYRGLVEASPNSIVAADMKGRILTVNPRTLAALRYERVEDLAGMHVLDLVAPDSHPRARDMFQRYLESGHQEETLEVQFLRRDGTTFPAEVSMAVIPDDNEGGSGLIVVARDISERKAYEDQLRHLAFDDPLTGLPNRTLFQDRLDQAVLLARHETSTVAVLMMDLDRFKDVNDTLGHRYGDLLLQQVAERFRAELRESDTLARLGGDEFAALLMDTDGMGATLTAGRLLSALTHPFDLDGHPFYVATSIGIAVYPDHGDDAASLLRRADVAMYNAKRRAVGSALYSATTDPNSTERLRLVAGLREAVKEKSFHLVYQPKLDLENRAVTAVEALVRWTHPDLGPIPPGRFITLAEETGLIRPLTSWILEEAIRQAHGWLDAGLPLKVAVNLSASNLGDPDLVDSIGTLLQRYDLPASQLEIEITESALMEDPEGSRAVLSFLHDIGISVSLDDFGTGYSSLSYLQRLPIDQIKIDRSFLLAMAAGDRQAGVIVGTVVDLGHNLGLRVVAEGVETQEQMDILAAMRCDVVQGYFVSRPLSPEKIPEWMEILQAARSSCGSGL